MTNKEYEDIIRQKDLIIDLYKHEISILKKYLAIFKDDAFTDSLTNLYNRRAVNINDNSYDSIIFGDIDHFKRINDEHGHDFGDLVLVEVSNVLKRIVRESDLVCRWGGEEFVILLKNCNDEDAYKKAIELKNEIASLSEKLGFEITMSFGISRNTGKTLKDAIDEADKAMYESKEKGRNTITIYKLSK